MWRESGIVALVAMHVDQQPALLGDGAERGDARRAVGHGPLEMRDAADDIDTEIEGAFEILRSRRGTVIAVLREGDELEVDIGGDPLFHVEQGLDGEEAIVADVDMGTDGEQALRDGKVAIAERPLGHRLMGEERLQLAPQANAFEQGAGTVEPGQAKRQGRVHVEMAVDEGRGDQPAVRLDGTRGLGGDAGFDGGDAAAFAGDVDAGAAIGKRRVADDEVEGHGEALRLPLLRGRFGFVPHSCSFALSGRKSEAPFPENAIAPP